MRPDVKVADVRPLWHGSHQGMRRPPLSLLLLALLLPAAIAATPAVRAENAWIRWLPANLPAAGYATLVNSGDVPEVLIGASSPDYGEVSLHQNLIRDGNVEMRPVERIAINPHSSLRLAAAGYHMMLMQPSKALKPGDRVTITLRFLSGTLAVQFEVRPADSPS
jgi:copper(I)-binding protein